MDRSTVLSPPPSLASLLANGPTAIFLDFDGTLVNIASGPDAIEVPGDLAARLEGLALRNSGRLALVTGRSISNLEQFLGPTRFHLAGSHGVHVVAPDGSTLHEADALPKSVSSKLKHFAREHGLLFENKAHGAALHFRARPDLAEIAQTFARSLAQASDLELKFGKYVIELVWPGTSKGAAVELLSTRPSFEEALPIFVGDDVTDEDGFAACNRLGGFGIAVGERASTHARYRLQNVRDVHAWLEL